MMSIRKWAYRVSVVALRGCGSRIRAGQQQHNRNINSSISSSSISSSSSSSSSSSNTTATASIGYDLKRKARAQQLLPLRGHSAAAGEQKTGIGRHDVGSSSSISDTSCISS